MLVEKDWLAVSFTIYPNGTRSGLGQDSVQDIRDLLYQTLLSMFLRTLEKEEGIPRLFPQSLVSKIVQNVLVS